MIRPGDALLLADVVQAGDDDVALLELFRDLDVKSKRWVLATYAAWMEAQ